MPPKDKELCPSCNNPRSVTVADGLSLGLGEALADPIVRALMAADGVEPTSVETLMRRTAKRRRAAVAGKIAAE